MGRYNFVSPGAAFGQGFEEFFVQREMERMQQERERLLREREAEERVQRERDFKFRESQEARITAEQQRVASRQAALDAEADEERRLALSDRRNQQGVRQMMADAVRQAPLTPDRARELSVMGWSEGVGVPGIISQATEAPKRTIVQTRDARGNPIRRAVTEDELIAGVPEYREPEKPREPTRAEVELPIPVQHYLQALTTKTDPATGQRYTQQRAEQEIANQWARLADAHPDLSPIRVKQALQTLFRAPDDFESLFGGDGAGGSAARSVPGVIAGGPATGRTPEGGGRTATLADVRAVAGQMGVTEQEARRQLEAAGVVIGR